MFHKRHIYLKSWLDRDTPRGAEERGDSTMARVKAFSFGEQGHWYTYIPIIPIPNTSKDRAARLQITKVWILRFSGFEVAEFLNEALFSVNFDELENKSQQTLNWPPVLMFAPSSRKDRPCPWSMDWASSDAKHKHLLFSLDLCKL